MVPVLGRIAAEEAARTTREIRAAIDVAGFDQHFAWNHDALLKESDGGR